MMSEIHNVGSRDITDVSVQIEFQSADGEVLDFMFIEVDRIEGHSSLAGDKLEMMVIGHTVWDQYNIKVDLQYTNYNGQTVYETWNHPVGVWSIEQFMDKADRTTWPMS